MENKIKDSQIQFRIDKDLKSKFQKECKKRGLTQSELLIEYIREKLEDFNPHKQQKIQF